MEPDDFYGTIRYLLKLRKNIGSVDDIDHLATAAFARLAS